MGMNEERPDQPASPSAASLDDLAAYALDAHEADDETAIEFHLLASPDAARWERALRDAAGELATGVDEVAPPPHLRQRVLAAAFRRRPPGTARRPAGTADDRGAVDVDRDVDGGSPVEVHRIELRRVLDLLDGLEHDDWTRSLDPPELAGWTVHDLVVHLAANESLLADRLGVPVPGAAETSGDNADRTAAARVRHRGQPPGAARAELRAAAEAVAQRVSTLDAEALDATIDWWGRPTPVRIALLVRAFESWTHADDIRRALHLPMLAAPPASLATMTLTACGWVPLMLAARGIRKPGRSVRFTFTDLPGTSYDVALDEVGVVRPPGSRPPDATIEVDAESFCRTVGNRVAPTELGYRSTGDIELAREVIGAVPALAVL